MSGIAGVLHLDGSPVEARLFGRMIDRLQFRGPRTHSTQPCPFIALGHAGLQLNDAEPQDPAQPFTLDGREWIVADGRMDARDDLVARLAAVDPVPPDAGDGELILRAYRAWGESCVEHLLGDFVFAIWDGPARRLFAARDQLGVKPLYYAEVGRTIVFSNSLDCVRAHPAVSSELNDAAIADFLLFGANQSLDTTSFRDIRRLPPAHALSWSPIVSSCRRYWTLPVDEPVVGKRASEYTDRFLELLRASVSDRLRTRRVGVLMSGGLDSTTLAAIAQETGRGRHDGTEVHAVTSIYERLIPDTERLCASLVARHLSIPIHFDVRDDEPSIADWNRVTVHTPEPVDNPPAFLAGTQFLTKMSEHARVFLYGEGPDNALQYEWRPFLAHLAARRRVGALISAVLSDLVMHPRVPLWSSVRELAGRRRAAARWRPVFPEWLDGDFARRASCRDRWEAQQQPVAPVHPIRPRGHQSFSSPRWQQLFEDCDIQGALARAEFRHPYLDLRLLQYLLTLPAMPWCRRKLILRRAMRPTLPAAVLRRKKAPVPANPDLERVAKSGWPTPGAAPGLDRFVDVTRMPGRPATALEMRAALRPLGLNYWLQDPTNH